MGERRGKMMMVQWQEAGVACVSQALCVRKQVVAFCTKEAIALPMEEPF